MRLTRLLQPHWLSWGLLQNTLKIILTFNLLFSVSTPENDPEKIVESGLYVVYGDAILIWMRTEEVSTYRKHLSHSKVDKDYLILVEIQRRMTLK